MPTAHKITTDLVDLNSEYNDTDPPKKEVSVQITEAGIFIRPYGWIATDHDEPIQIYLDDGALKVRVYKDQDAFDPKELVVEKFEIRDDFSEQ